MKTVIVTGANSGLGLWTAKYLLDKNYRVIMACRSLEKAQKAIDAFPAFDRSKNYILKELDLADFDSIKNFVSQLSGQQELYGLICNAGISYKGPVRYTKNGIEETFGVNHLGHFLLTNLLLQKLNPERIVIISSELHDPGNKSPFAKAVFKPVDLLSHPVIQVNDNLSKLGEEFYATSKLCNLLFAYELDRKLANKTGQHKTLVNAINPGLILATNLGRTHKPGEKISRILFDLFFRLIGLAHSAPAAAKNIVRLMDEVTSGGKYYYNQKAISSSADSYDLQKAAVLWEGSELLVGLKFSFA